MIGNDIVDTEAASAESNPLRRGWINKVYAPSEKEFIGASGSSVQILWLLWSMKEAAYKIFNRCSGTVFYAPQKFICKLQEQNAMGAAGIVTFGAEQYFTTSIISPGFIHSTATMIQGEAPHINIYPIKTLLSDILPEGYQFVRQEGNPPLLFNKQTREYIPVSYSHHGRWHALAFDHVKN